MDKSNRIFVAGNGLVGRTLTGKLLDSGYTNLLTVSKNQLDLRNQGAVEQWFDKYRPQYVFNAAAKVGGIQHNRLHPAEFLYDNLCIQNNLINASWKFGVSKFLFLGSSCVYPKACPQPIREEYLLTSELEPTNEAYALAKIAGLKLCDYYTKQYSFNTISPMPCNLYGPYDNFDTERSHVIPGMIVKFIRAQIQKQDHVVAWGDGTPLREFLYTEDLADACIFLMKHYDTSDLINVGSDTEISIRDLSELISNLVGYRGQVVWDTSMPNGTPRKKLDTTRLFDLGWRPKVGFEQGLINTIKWFKENRYEMALNA